MVCRFGLMLIDWAECCSWQVWDARAGRGRHFGASELPALSGMPFWIGIGVFRYTLCAWWERWNGIPRPAGALPGRPVPRLPPWHLTPLHSTAPMCTLSSQGWACVYKLCYLNNLRVSKIFRNTLVISTKRWVPLIKMFCTHCAHFWWAIF